jgi:mono/diheme cytochrome c family protein
MFSRLMVRLLCALVTAAAWGPVFARDNVWQLEQDNAVWRAECGACHMAFPPGLLTADDWLDLMSRLDQHFGVDASLEPKAKAEIADYLKQNGASNRLFGSRDEVPRITTTDRFVAKHRSAIRLWQRGKIKSLTDCASCHKADGMGSVKE